jgi:hypothetical protein
MEHCMPSYTYPGQLPDREFIRLADATLLTDSLPLDWQCHAISRLHDLLNIADKADAEEAAARKHHADLIFNAITRVEEALEAMQSTTESLAAGASNGST